MNDSVFEIELWRDETNDTRVVIRGDDEYAAIIVQQPTSKSVWQDAENMEYIPQVNKDQLKECHDRIGVVLKSFMD